MLPKESQELESFLKFKSEDLFINYKFDINDLLRIKIDLSFNNNNTINQIKNSQKSVDYAIDILNKYPEVKPIVHVLKRFLNVKRLNSSFNGGLSSFSLFLLIIAYLKYPKVKTKMNLGRVLLEFLELFGKHFDYAQTIIDVNLFK